MRISTKGRYALEALLYLALSGEECLSTRQIAEGTGISDGYLEQIFIPLRKAGLLRGLRGPTGGYTLAKPPAEICVGDALRAVEGSLKPAACVDAHFCAKEKVCENRRTWSELYRGITGFIDSVTLASLVDDYRAGAEPEYAI